MPGQGTVSPPPFIEGTASEGASSALIAGNPSSPISPSMPGEVLQGRSGSPRTPSLVEKVDPETGEVTWERPAGASGPPDESTTAPPTGGSRQDTESAAISRRQRRGHLHKLRRITQKYTVIKRKKACGQLPVDAITGQVGIQIRRETQAGFGGVTNCGSPSCPICRSRKAAEKAEEEQLLLEDTLARGGSVLFMTLTFPHDWGMDYKPMRDAVDKAWRAMTSYRAWKQLRESYGLEWTKCCDDTHGGNGWHPHFHALLRLNRDLTDDELEQLRGTIFGMWAKRMKRSGYREPAPECCPVERMKDPAKAAAYISKVGITFEVTSPTTKQAKTGHRSSWQIAEDMGKSGRPRDIALWREWEVGIKGRTAVSRCKASQARLKQLKLQLDDQAEVDEPVEEVRVVAVMKRQTWAKVRSIWGMGAELLDAAERGGRQGVERVLARLDWPAGYDPLLPEVPQWVDDWTGERELPVRGEVFSG